MEKGLKTCLVLGKLSVSNPYAWLMLENGDTNCVSKHQNFSIKVGYCAMGPMRHRMYKERLFYDPI